jgi:hypothetical protein
MLKRIGFFRELRHGDPAGPSLREGRGKLRPASTTQVVRYLMTAPALAVTGALVDDALDPARKGVASLEIATDGVWVWPRDLAYYVREYGVDVPAEFTAVVEERAGEPPVLSMEDLERVEAEYLRSS